jgi:putative ABC transport system permease protein
MIKWIEIAFLNILKNRRRSFVTLLAIAIGFAAVKGWAILLSTRRAG